MREGDLKIENIFTTSLTLLLIHFALTYLFIKVVN